MKKTIENKAELIAACGLYCGSCGSYQRGKCPGCAEKTNATWCKVRSCCLQSSISNCSQCEVFGHVNDCKHFNSPVAKLFAFIFRSDRVSNIETLKVKGPKDYAGFMSANRLISIKK